MTTVRNLADEFDAQPFELRAFADDLLDGCENDTDEIPAENEATIREAWSAACQDEALDLVYPHKGGKPMPVARQDEALDL